MHDALALPEIVAKILQAGAASPGFLYTCLSINRLFSLETTRILWKGCGIRHNSATAGHVTPGITELANIVQWNRERGQYYANFIHILEFDEEGEDNDFIEEARWHTELAAVQFPNLQDVGFYGFAEAMPLNTADVVLHYAQPSVKYLTLGEASRLSDSFLDALHHRCPRLESFTLGDISESHLSEDGVVRFIDNSASLDYLNIRAAFHENWTLRQFEAVARHRNLALLSIPDVPDDWIDSLGRGSSVTPAFSSLKHFTSGMSDHGLGILAQYVPSLQSLSLELQQLSPSHHLLASASGFAQLTSLSIEFGPSSSLSGYDLVLLARQCPELVSLTISEWDGHRPSGVGITDSIINEAARGMGKISELFLAFARPDMLTWESVLSIARHCKHIKQLGLSCNFNWNEAMVSAPANTFPMLWNLSLVLDANNRAGQLAEAGREEEILHTFADQFAAFAPQLSIFRIEGGDEVDEALAKAISNICYPRYVPRPLGSTD